MSSFAVSSNFSLKSFRVSKIWCNPMGQRIVEYCSYYFRRTSFFMDCNKPKICVWGSILEELVHYMMYVPVPQKLFFFPKDLSLKKGLCLSMWDWCRFNEAAGNYLISSNKVVLSTISSKKALVITFNLKNALRLNCGL